MGKILALDIAGLATGWAVGKDGTLLEYGKIISVPSRPRPVRLFEFAYAIYNLCKKYKPDQVIIEKPFLGRNSGVLVNLSKYIAVAELMIYMSIGIVVDDTCFLDPRHVKKTMKVAKPTGKNKHDQNKQIMVKKINQIYGLRLKFKSGNNKKLTDDDIADAIALLHVRWSETDGKKEKN